MPFSNLVICLQLRPMQSEHSEPSGVKSNAACRPGNNYVAAGIAICVSRIISLIVAGPLFFFFSLSFSSSSSSSSSSSLCLCLSLSVSLVAPAILLVPANQKRAGVFQDCSVTSKSLTRATATKRQTNAVSDSRCMIL